ncbi:hypothetical protein [uncultured Bacteroides sp.]|uniref:hypothetical protein n=1 Tax=uncultured Bacteroides sp. TaxID=162156 RepID=UPI002AA90B48|nr:hypothetical protein [uncultured Bacteroides sp.]
MIAKESTLILERFDILESACNCIFTDDETLDLLESTKKQPIDIDFRIKTDNNGIFIIFTDININRGNEPAPGYSISVSGAGMFRLPQDVPESETQGYVNSGVNICITNLRSYINTITSFYPIGKFSFHSIDMPALFKSKQELIDEK